MTSCFSTPEDIAVVRVLALKGALKLETLGLKGRVSAYAIVKREFGFKGNKARVLEQLTEYVEARLPAKVQA